MMSLVDTWWTLHMAPHGNHGTVRMSGSNTVPGSSCKSHVQKLQKHKQICPKGESAWIGIHMD